MEVVVVVRVQLEVVGYVQWTAEELVANGTAWRFLNEIQPYPKST
jgi:hypothetical protein